MTWWPVSGSCFVFAAAVGEGHEVEGIAEALLFQDVLLVVVVARGRSRSQPDGWRRVGVMTMLRQAMTALMVMARRSRPEVRNGMNLTRHGAKLARRGQRFERRARRWFERETRCRRYRSHSCSLIKHRHSPGFGGVSASFRGSHGTSLQGSKSGSRQGSSGVRNQCVPHRTPGVVRLHLEFRPPDPGRVRRDISRFGNRCLWLAGPWHQRANLR